MGHTIRLSLISASKYLKYLRPKFFQCYGRINQERAQRGQKSRLYSANFINTIGSGSLHELMFKLHKPNDGPVTKYLQSGCLNTKQSQQEMYNCFKKYAKQIYYDPNHFLRLDEYLQQIDSFTAQGFCMKVSNILQVQNYCFYLEEVNKILQQHPNCQWASQYFDVNWAKQIFTNCYKQMNKKKVETYLIFEINS